MHLFHRSRVESVKRKSIRTVVLRWLAVSVLLIATAGAAEAQLAPRWQAAVDARVFAQYMRSGTLRGADGFGSANWFMGSISRQGPGRSIGAKVMVSLEPFTIG